MGPENCLSKEAHPQDRFSNRQSPSEIDTNRWRRVFLFEICRHPTEDGDVIQMGFVSILVLVMVVFIRGPSLADACVRGDRKDQRRYSDDQAPVRHQTKHHCGCPLGGMTSCCTAFTYFRPVRLRVS